MLPFTNIPLRKPIAVGVTRLAVNPRMSLMDLNGVRLVLGKDARSASRDMEAFTWIWDIAVRTDPRKNKRLLRCLVEEIAEQSQIDILYRSPAQIVDRILGPRTGWGVTDVSNLLLCSREHAHALMRGKNPALPTSSKRGQPMGVARAALEKFLLERLVNK